MVSFIALYNLILEVPGDKSLLSWTIPELNNFIFFIFLDQA